MSKPTIEDTISWMSRNMTPKFFERVHALNSGMWAKSEPGFYDGVRKLDSEVDLEITISLQEVAPDAKHLTIHRTKPRPASEANVYYLVDSLHPDVQPDRAGP